MCVLYFIFYNIFLSNFQTFMLSYFCNSFSQKDFFEIQELKKLAELLREPDLYAEKAAQEAAQALENCISYSIGNKYVYLTKKEKAIILAAVSKLISI